MAEHDLLFPADPTVLLSQFTYHDLQLMSQSSPASHLRVVALVDYDSFYAQYESVRLGIPQTKPLAVRQWNAIIALNYAAKQRGLKRTISVDDARRICPDVVLQHVPTWREGDPCWRYRADVLDHLKTDKASLDPYRQVSRKTIQLVKRLLPSKPSPTIERAGVDEFYLDLSAQIYGTLAERFPTLTISGKKLDDRLPLPPADTLMNWDVDKVMNPSTADGPYGVLDWDDVVLNIAAEVVRNIRHEIKKQLQLTTSAGISINKMVAKAASRMNKPAGQTVIRRKSIPSIMPTLKATSLSGLGRQLGQRVVKTFGSDNIRDLLQVSLADMKSQLGADDGDWVFKAIRGIETGPVRPRSEVQSLLAAKTFVPKAEDLQHASKWLRMFAADLESRLHDLDLDSEIPRRPRTIAVHHHINGRFGPTRSKQAPIPPKVEINQETIFNMLYGLLKDLTEHGESWPCLGISVSMSNLEAGLPAVDTPRITSFFSTNGSPSPRKRTRQHEELNGAESTAKRQAVRSPGIDTTIMPAERGRDSDKDEGYLCPKCGELVQADSVLEHLDWHVAMEIQDHDDQLLDDVNMNDQTSSKSHLQHF